MTDRVYIVKGVQHAPQFRGVIITPEAVTQEEVTIAWSHAVRYTAKGYDVPDYDAALTSVAKRHPEWKISPHEVISINYHPSKADLET